MIWHTLWRFWPCKPIAMGMDANSSLTVRVGQSGSKYIWQLYREGIVHKVKYCGPIYPSEESATRTWANIRVPIAAPAPER